MAAPGGNAKMVLSCDCNAMSVWVDGQMHNFIGGQGSLFNTTSVTDLAIAGDGFFELLSRLEPTNAQKEYYLTDAVGIVRKSGRGSSARPEPGRVTRGARCGPKDAAGGTRPDGRGAGGVRGHRRRTDAHLSH